MSEFRAYRGPAFGYAATVAEMASTNPSEAKRLIAHIAEDLGRLMDLLALMRPKERAVVVELILEMDLRFELNLDLTG